MLNESKVEGVAPGLLEGARSATGCEPGAVTEVKRWSAGRKKAIVLRLLLAGIDAALKERENDPLEQQLDEAKRRIGELVMEVEILQSARRAKRPLVGRRSSR